MNCRRVSNLLSAYIDGELTGTEMFEIRRHLGECRSCDLQYQSLRMSKQLLSRLRYAEPRPGLAESICASLDTIRVPRYQRVLNRLAFVTWKRMTPVTAGCAVLGAVLMFIAAQPVDRPQAAANFRPMIDSSSLVRLESPAPTSEVFFAPELDVSRSLVEDSPREELAGAGMFVLTSFGGQ